MTVLVTGATGFLGSRLVRALASAGVRVRALARNVPALEGMQREGIVEAYPCDLRDRDAVIAACQGIETVFHLGALTAPWGPKSEFQQINVEGTKAIVMGCRVYGVRRLIFASTPLVQFDGTPQVTVQESAPYVARPLSLLASAKQEGERAVLGAAGEGLSTIVLRLGPVYGPGDRRFLPPLLSLARARRSFRRSAADETVWSWSTATTPFVPFCWRASAPRPAAFTTLAAASRSISGASFAAGSGRRVWFRTCPSSRCRPR